MSEESAEAKRNRFVAAQDLLLLEETEHKDPFHAQNSAQVWKEIAENLTKTKMFKADLSDRACRARVNKLVDAHIKEDWQNLIKSGSAEDYDKIHILLTALAAAKRDVADTKLKVKAKKDAATKKRDIATVEVQAAGDTTFMKPKKSDALDEYRLPGSSEALSDSSDSDDADLPGVKGPPKEDDEKSAKRARKRHRRLRTTQSSKGAAEIEVVKAITAGDRLKFDFKTKELAQTAELKDKELQFQKDQRDKELQMEHDSREAESVRKHQVRMRELDLEDRRLAIRERELALQEKNL